MNLLKLEQEKRELESHILEEVNEETGEINPDYEQKLQLLNNQMLAKAEQYTFLLKDKFFEDLEKRIDEEIKSLKKQKELIRRRKELTELALHNFTKERANGNGYFEAEMEGKKLYVLPDYSVKREVIEEKVPEEIGTYIVEMDYETYKLIRHLRDFKVKRKVLISDVNDDFLKKTIRPTVKIVKTKPRGN